jgi:hypothetical protein
MMRWAQRTNQDEPVTLYFLHLHYCGTLVPDEEGREFSSMAAAVEQAQEEARGLLAGEVREGKLCLGCQVEVVEESTGRAVIVPFSSTVQLESAIEDKPDMRLHGEPPLSRASPD